jgi:hypothetical protein
MFTPDVEKTVRKMEAAGADPKIKRVADRLQDSKRLFLDRPNTPAGVMAASRRLHSRQKAFDRLGIDKT